MAHCGAALGCVQMSEPDFKKEWQTYYRAIGQICARYGKDDASGAADYWLTDDNWGGVTQRLIVHSPSFLKPKMINEIMAYLNTIEPYGVMVEVILDLNFNGQRLSPMMGLVVDRSCTIEHWDLSAMRAKVGSDFYIDR
jgi:hypothetical protein